MLMMACDVDTALAVHEVYILFLVRYLMRPSQQFRMLVLTVQRGYFATSWCQEQPLVLSRCRLWRVVRMRIQNDPLF